MGRDGTETGTDDYANHKTILWDNLRAHKTPFFINMIEDREYQNAFASIYRPPYAPKLAPIEYILCELSAELCGRCNQDWIMDYLRYNISIL